MSDELNDQQKMLAELRAPFPKEAIKTHPEQRDRNGKPFRYVDLGVVVDRLNVVTSKYGVYWHQQIIGQEIHPFGKTAKGIDRLLLTANVEISIPTLGSKQHTGVQVVNATNGGEDLWKGAVSDAIKKTASLFGVGHDLYTSEVEMAPAASTPTGDTPEHPGVLLPKSYRDRFRAIASERGLEWEKLEVLAFYEFNASMDTIPKDDAAEFGARLASMTPDALQAYIDGLFQGQEQKA